MTINQLTAKHHSAYKGLLISWGPHPVATWLGVQSLRPGHNWCDPLEPQGCADYTGWSTTISFSFGWFIADNFWPSLMNDGQVLLECIFWCGPTKIGEIFSHPDRIPIFPCKETFGVIIHWGKRKASIGGTTLLSVLRWLGPRTDDSIVGIAPWATWIDEWKVWDMIDYQWNKKNHNYSSCSYFV